MMLFDSWSDLVRVAVLGTSAYVALVGALRVSGKRTLAKLNAFDLVVTVALGSTLATIILSRDVSLVEGLVAFAVLVGAQLVVAWLCVRFESVRQAAKSEPTTLLRDGEMLLEVMARQRITAGEIRQAVRASGRGGLDGLAAIVLETDGTLSVIPCGDVGDGRALEGRRGDRDPRLETPDGPAVGADRRATEGVDASSATRASMPPCAVTER